ncbi:hypothetical protein BIY37_07280 [Candidatus Brocadia sapporoensis]|uniref:Chemotaxis phosphatase CheX-like domain-containing protein n=1 Tax=Candidatus Brocadia sapporoensis TaxID=392547 RepID=A0A1V6LZQ9_9BACT|nr:chemotaxis protein CheX [Candidatus Brocadia sapporoensis]MDG6005922.1 chemotaxis protein CheX [Candidatus Brocadia sp.]OQD45652.1 hypothetical protein BIY37_07280 [Candidatus Brocadia sapporoensis]GJQ23861.1 MAG: chemotaxis protein CheX [Candidatus Brocadia sapporoensis]
MAPDSMMENIALDIAESTKILFETMVMLDLQHTASFLTDDNHIKTDIIGMVSFTGKYYGVIALFCSQKFSLKIASNLLMTEVTQLTMEVKDAIGEIAKMIADTVRMKISAYYGDMHLSVPVVITGGSISITAINDYPAISDATLSCFSSDPWLIMPFTSHNEKFNIGLLLKESNK